MSNVAPSLADQLELGYTLPADWYTDPAILRRERERIFARSWQYAGRAEQRRGSRDRDRC
jgi:phenylpropionate dioxygenase-like ring-hydroxylating dioxygenase large terminal subunit